MENCCLVAAAATHQSVHFSITSVPAICAFNKCCMFKAYIELFLLGGDYQCTRVVVKAPISKNHRTLPSSATPACGGEGLFVAVAAKGPDSRAASLPPPHSTSGYKSTVSVSLRLLAPSASSSGSLPSPPTTSTMAPLRILFIRVSRRVVERMAGGTASPSSSRRVWRRQTDWIILAQYSSRWRHSVEEMGS